MKITAFKMQEDGILDLSNPIVVETTQAIPDGYRLVTPEDDLSYGEPLEIEPQEPSDVELLMLAVAELADIMMGG